MMWGFGMLWMLLLPLLVIGALVVLGAMLIGGGWRLVRNPSRGIRHRVSPVSHPVAMKTCPSCGRPLPQDWRFCPYDGMEVGNYEG